MSVAPNADDLGPYLARLRIKRGLSQAQLGDCAFVCHSMISRVERGQRTPSYDLIENIAGALKLQPDERGTLLVKAGFLPDDLSVLIDPLAVTLSDTLANLAGQPEEAKVRTAVELILRAVA